MEEGITEVPCLLVDHLSEAQKKAYILADNRMAMDAGSGSGTGTDGPDENKPEESA